MDTSKQEVPNSLRNWLVFHFYVDYAFAIPFFFVPETTAEILGYDPLDPLAARIVAAALFGIGYSSLLASKFDLEAMRTKLRFTNTEIDGDRFEFLVTRDRNLKTKLPVAYASSNKGLILFRLTMKNFSEYSVLDEFRRSTNRKYVENL
jgi:hypothetical protein